MEKTNMTNGKDHDAGSAGATETQKFNGRERLDYWLKHKTSPFEAWVVQAVACLVPGDKATYAKKGTDPVRYTAVCNEIEEGWVQTVVRKNGDVLFTENYFHDEDHEDFVQLPLSGEIAREANPEEMARRKEFYESRGMSL